MKHLTWGEDTLHRLTPESAPPRPRSQPTRSLLGVAFGLGLSLYFASQGAGRLLWPLLAGLCRMLIALGGGGLALYLTGSLQWLFGFLALALVMYGLILVIAVRSGVWFRSKRSVVRLRRSK